MTTSKMNFLEKVVAALFLFGGAMMIAALLGVLIALPIQFLWNNLCPDLFGSKSISFIQALMAYGLVASFASAFSVSK